MGKWFSRRQNDLSPDHYWAALALGTIICRVTSKEQELCQTVLRCEADLLMPLLIDELGEMGQLDLRAALFEFFQSRAQSSTVPVDVCKTIEKWGQAIQFRQTVSVEFRKTAA